MTCLKINFSHRRRIAHLWTSYPVFIGKDSLKKLPMILKQVSPSKIFCITSPRIAALHWKKIKAHIPSSYPLHKIEMDDIESNKSLKSIQKIVAAMLDKSADRHSLVMGLGGGVICDLSGFCASIFLRGVPYISIPTTLLSQSDSCIGGKCGINLPQGKNLLGSFYPPKAVLCDISLLSTLSDRDFKSGLVEILKHALISGKKSKLWSLLMTQRKKILARDPKMIGEVILESLKVKKIFIEADEHDQSIRNILNFGHTIGHALEASHHYSLSHGEAVAQGIFFALYLSFQKRLCSKNTIQSIENLLATYNIHPERLPKKVLTYIGLDKKREMGVINWILMKDIGNLVQVKIPFTPHLNVESTSKNGSYRQVQ